MHSITQHTSEKVKFVFSSGCNINIQSGYTTISSPGFGVAMYPSNVNCSWRISDPHSRALTLLFHPPFDTEPSMDVVRVSTNGIWIIRSTILCECKADLT